MLDCYLAWKQHGALPFGGGYAEQPAGLIQAMNAAASTWAKFDLAERRG